MKEREGEVGLEEEGTWGGVSTSSSESDSILANIDLDIHTNEKRRGQ